MLSYVSLLAVFTLGAEPLKPGDHTRSIEVDKLTRTYIVHVPKSYDAAKPHPVVLVFHGGATNAEITVSFCGLNDKSDEAGFIAVYPNGSGPVAKILTWNAGNCCGYAMRNKIDDVAFTKALLDNLAKSVNIDPKRVYATGISNGAMMSYLLASELSDRIAAIAPIAGPMGTEECSPKRPVSVIHFHGLDDQFAPFKGGKSKRELVDFYSVDHSINAWVKANGCPEDPAVVNEPDKAKDGTKVIRKTFGPGKEDSEVVLYSIEGGGHTWPGREIKLEKLGKSTKQISANDLMWEFFKKHPMK